MCLPALMLLLSLAAAPLAYADAPGTGGAPAGNPASAQEALTLAEAALFSGDLTDARRLLEAGFGPDVVRLPDARAPLISQSLLNIDSGPAGRRIVLSFVDGDQGASATRLVTQTAEALRNLAPVMTSNSALTVTLAYTDPAALVAAQGRLAAALPHLPELALASAALSSRRLAWPEDANLVARIARYEERVDLSASAAAWDAEAAKLEKAAAAAVERAGVNPSTFEERLDDLRATLWRADARAWRDLAALSRATYRVELQERGAGPEWLQARVHEFYREGSISREWVVRAGEVRQLEAAVLGWRYDRLALAAGAAVLLAALAVVGMWLMVS